MKISVQRLVRCMRGVSRTGLSRAEGRQRTGGQEGTVQRGQEGLVLGGGSEEPGTGSPEGYRVQ